MRAVPSKHLLSFVGRPLNRLFILFLALPLESGAFCPVARPTIVKNGLPRLTKPTVSYDVVNHSGSSSLFMVAGKKRKRRKSSPSLPTQPDALLDELPDFDDMVETIAEEANAGGTKLKKPAQIKSTIAVSTTAAKPTPLKRGSGLNSQLAEELGGNVDGLDEDFILSTMQGKAGGDKWQPPQSIQETISDRRLERLMDFDAMIEGDGDGGVQERVELPTMEEVISRRKQREAATATKDGRVEEAAMLIDAPGMGKKAARTVQRKAAAIEREAMEENASEKSPLEDLNIFKLLENGAWVGIGLLVLLEFYINSPLFERAAPLIPVVYENQVPPGM